MSCLVCLQPVGGADYHRDCARQLFATTRVPAIDIDRARLETFALAMVGHKTLSGAQEKLSLGYTPDRTRLVVSTSEAQFILKPQQGRFGEVPQNEHLTMQMARAVGIEVPPCGLVRLADDSLAYLVRRFDREAGRKLPVEDFCQLARKHPAEKYDGSAELCVRLLRRFASEPLPELRAFVQRMVFVWCTGNGDMHLKNFALLTREGITRLSPAYDLLCTRLVIPEDQLALPMAGKRARLQRRDFDELARYAGLPERAGRRAIEAIVAGLKQALALVPQSLLSPQRQEAYAEMVSRRVAAL